jgi:hypothetical protein
MKTAMELALARIELMKDINPDSIHWEMFKNDCIEKEKEQIICSYIANRYVNAGGYPTRRDEAEQYYNQTYNQEPKKEYQPSEEYLKKQKELMEDFIWNKMNKNNQNK